jgi:DNA polymerase I
MIGGIPQDQVTPDQRRSAKAINFGRISGMPAFGLAQQLCIDHALAQRYIDTSFQQYPGVKCLKWRNLGSRKRAGSFPV